MLRSFAQSDSARRGVGAADALVPLGCEVIGQPSIQLLNPFRLRRQLNPKTASATAAAPHQAACFTPKRPLAVCCDQCCLAAGSNRGPRATDRARSRRRKTATAGSRSCSRRDARSSPSRYLRGRVRRNQDDRLRSAEALQRRSANTARYRPFSRVAPSGTYLCASDGWWRRHRGGR